MLYNSVMQQYFIQEKFNLNQTFTLDDEQTHHLLCVLRAKVGKVIRVVDIDGYYDDVVISIENNHVYFTIHHLNQQVKKTHVIALVALIKKDKWDFALMKAAELGVDEIIPLMTQRCVVKVKENSFKKERYQKILDEACEQCKRASKVILHDPMTIKQLPVFDGFTRLIPYENEKSTHIKNVAMEDNIVFAIGPEGGFDCKEVELFINKGYQCVTLGTRILRAETALMYSLCAIDLIKGDYA